MTVVTNTQNLQINTAYGFNLFFIFQACSFYFTFINSSVRNMNISRIDIYMIEQMGVHEAIIALHGLSADGIVLVQIKSDDVFKAQPFFLVHAYQFGIQSFRTGASSQTQHTWLIGRLLGTD